jgi:hypothetical protein
MDRVGDDQPCCLVRGRPVVGPGCLVHLDTRFSTIFRGGTAGPPPRADRNHNSVPRLSGVGPRSDCGPPYDFCVVVGLRSHRGRPCRGGQVLDCGPVADRPAGLVAIHRTCGECCPPSVTFRAAKTACDMQRVMGPQELRRIVDDGTHDTLWGCGPVVSQWARAEFGQYCIVSLWPLPSMPGDLRWKFYYPLGQY